MRWGRTRTPSLPKSCLIKNFYVAQIATIDNGIVERFSPQSCNWSDIFDITHSVRWLISHHISIFGNSQFHILVKEVMCKVITSPFCSIHATCQFCWLICLLSSPPSTDYCLHSSFSFFGTTFIFWIQVSPKMKNLNERATLFKITSNAMINACTEFMELTQTQGQCFWFLYSCH